MGRVRTKTIKKASKLLVEKYYPRLTTDFAVNKKITDEVTVTPSKRMRNKIAGYATHLMKRLKKAGNIRGISIKLQESERERRENYVPDVSVIDTSNITIDGETHDLLKTMGFADLQGLYGNKLEIEVQPGSLKVVVPSGKFRVSELLSFWIIPNC